MDLTFKVQAAALNSAMDIVSIVQPRPATPQGASGYLFVIRKSAEGKGRCYIYSRDSLHVARADLEVTDIEGDGEEFVYPATHIESFKHADGEIRFAVHSEGDVHTVRYVWGANAGFKHSTFDPKILSTCDQHLEQAGAEREFPVAILKEAVNMGRDFAAKPQDARVDEQFKTVQVMDAAQEALAKADGYMFASDIIRAYYFYSDAFRGKPLAVHGQHLAQLSAFLAKAVGTVKVKTGANMSFIIDANGRVFGWAHHTKTYQKFSYYALKNDKIILGVPKAQMLGQLRYIKTGMESDQDKIRLTFDLKGLCLRFSVLDSKTEGSSLPIEVKLDPSVASEAKDFAANVNLDFMINLFNDAKADEVELRVAIVPPGENRPKETAMFRTIDEFWLNDEGKVVAGSRVPEGKEPAGAYRCKVTRFMPGKD
jgi:hypothetical protein